MGTPVCHQAGSLVCESQQMFHVEQGYSSSRPSGRRLTICSRYVSNSMLLLFFFFFFSKNVIHHTGLRQYIAGLPDLCIQNIEDPIDFKNKVDRYRRDKRGKKGHWEMGKRQNSSKRKGSK